jgi:hypothetical protein
MQYFKAYELVDRLTYEKMGENALSLFTPEILEALDGVREYFDEPITVNNWFSGGKFQWRGYRTPEKAKMLGSPNSEHAKGNAFDFDIKGISAEEARRVIKLNQNDPLLRGIMRLEANVSWVHIDCKPVNNRIYLFKA